MKSGDVGERGQSVDDKLNEVQHQGPVDGDTLEQGRG